MSRVSGNTSGARWQSDELAQSSATEADTKTHSQTTWSTKPCFIMIMANPREEAVTAPPPESRHTGQSEHTRFPVRECVSELVADAWKRHWERAWEESMTMADDEEGSLTKGGYYRESELEARMSVCFIF